MSRLWSVTCHMGSHSVTCHLTQVNVPRLNLARHASTQFTTPKGWKAELTLVAGCGSPIAHQSTNHLITMHAHSNV